jgi:uncharacterized protein YihD (DUF1040 family)
MLLQKKITNLINGHLKCLAIYSDNTIKFIYKESPVNIYQTSLFNYEVQISSDIVFSGNYLQLEGFIIGFKNYYKSNEIELKNPKNLDVQLINIFKGIAEEASYKKQIEELNKEIVKLKNNIEKNDSYKKQLEVAQKAGEKRNKKIESLNKEIETLNKEIENLKNDCEESASIISDLYYKKEDIEYGTKHYKLENFSQEAQDFLKDIIKEYYNKK